MLRRSKAGLPGGEMRSMTLDDLARRAHFAAQGLMDCALNSVRRRASENRRPSADKMEAEQHAVHGLAWLATYVEAERAWAARRP
jgi:(2S)-methylsuccinyl-CoA dehydrogenase